jgi:GH24 family phage-related lysozyme (muramidase)
MVDYVKLLKAARDQEEDSISSRDSADYRLYTKFGDMGITIREAGAVDESKLAPSERKSFVDKRRTQPEDDLDFFTTYYNNIRQENLMLADEMRAYLDENNLESPKTTSSKTSNVADFISSFEQPVEKNEYKAYWDVSRWSIGFGSKAKSEDEVITAEEAIKRRDKDIQESKSVVMAANKKHKYGWSDNQIDALTSFTYNAGRGNFNSLIEGGNRGTEEVSNMLLEYNRAGGKVSEGLKKRRKAEYDLFNIGY